MMKKRKRYLAVLLSMGLMMACVLSASAATAAAQHTHSFDFANAAKSKEITYNPGNHTTTTYKAAQCKSCGEWGRSILDVVTESHTMTYSDAGHTSEKVHDYRASCSYCGYSTLFSIYCNGGSNHARP